MAIEMLRAIDVEPVTAWAEDLDEPIQLARFDCCGRYVCRCRQEEEA